MEGHRCRIAKVHSSGKVNALHNPRHANGSAHNTSVHKSLHESFSDFEGVLLVVQLQVNTHSP
jgi:hypothetical protein